MPGSIRGVLERSTLYELVRRQEKGSIREVRLGIGRSTGRSACLNCCLVCFFLIDRRLYSGGVEEYKKRMKGDHVAKRCGSLWKYLSIGCQLDAKREVVRCLLVGGGG